MIRGNVIEGKGEENATGIYVWGTSRYNDQPGENVTIADNQITAQTTAISLNGTSNVQIANNIVNLGSNEPKPLVVKRTTELKSDLE